MKKTYPLLVFVVSGLLVFPWGGCDPVNVVGPAPVPITGDLFPLVNGRQFVYTGYAISTAGNPLPDPGGVFRTSWVVDGVDTAAGSTMLIDTTTLFISGLGTVTRVDTIQIRKDTTSGDFEVLQSVGPFFRQYRIAPVGRTDTARWVAVSRQSVGLGGTWVAHDSTYVDSAGAAVRLQIRGAVEAAEAITDSSTADSTWSTYRVRTHMSIYVADSIVVSSATVTRLWLVPGVGPIQAHIAHDPENFGYFRVLRSKNF